MPPTRFTTFIIVTAVALTAVFLLSSSSRKVASDAAHAVNVPELPDALKDRLPSLDHIPVRFSWHRSGHKPPTQKNSTSGDAAWFSDWRWLNPFSSSVTLDEDRAVLPPLPDRPYVYTYYETDSTKDKETQKVDEEVLLTWRRAWWAAGFRPVTLTQAEATSNPLYRELRFKGVPKALEYEFSRWLAWEHMGTGLLADYYCLPMAAYDDDLLSHLRRGQFAQLTRFDGLGSGLFAGEKKAISAAIQEAFKDARLSTYHSVMDAIENKKGTFRVEQPTALAYYDSTALQKHYSAVADSLLASPNKGRLELNKLIILHLHNTWQNAFSSGIEVLKPLPAHTTALIEPSLHLAQLLVECPPSILPSSCPPNNQRCSPCVSHKTRITQPEAFSNKSSIYTISTVPHPYTMIALNNATSEITVRHIRRNTDRDAWIYAITRRILGDGRGGPSRVVALKDAVASEFGSSRSLWFTVESFPAEDFFSPDTSPEKTPSNDVQQRPQAKAPFPETWLEEVDWHFGFPISRTTVSHGESMNPVPLPERWQKGQAGIPADKKKSWDPADPTHDQKITELSLLRKARDTIKSKDKHVKTVRDVAEKWNLADLEAWRFVRAYRAREIVERKLYEEEESKYSGSGSGRKSRWWYTS